jgi:hypothetical protein
MCQEADMQTITNLTVDPRSVDLLAVDEALAKLAEVEARKARATELRFVGGLQWTVLSCKSACVALRMLGSAPRGRILRLSF